MGSQLFEVLRQGIWASVTGGWFHDPRQPLFINTLHLYLWLFLLALPLALNIYVASSVVVWSAYCGAIGVLFISLKTINARFHYLFDTSEAIPEPVTISDPSIPSVQDCEDSNGKKSRKGRPRNLGLDEDFGVELHVLETNYGNGQASNNANEHTPQGGPLKVDVHRRESSSSASSSSSCSSSRAKQKDDFSSGNAVNSAASETKVSVEASALSEVISEKYRDDASASHTPVDPENFPSLSPVSQGPSILSEVGPDFFREGKRLHNLFSLESGLENSSTPCANLSGTTSLELGQVLSQTEKSASKRQQFRRTKSALETSSSSGTGSKLDSKTPSHTVRGEEDCTQLNSRSHRLSSSCHSRIPSPEKRLQHTSRSSKVSKKKQKCDDKKEDKVESSVDSGANYIANPDRSEASDSDSDDHARSRTPLLARHSNNSSLEQKSKSQNLKKEYSSESNCGSKKVSFSSQSLDEEKCKRCFESNNGSRRDSSGGGGIVVKSDSIRESSSEVDEPNCPHDTSEGGGGGVSENGIINETRFMLVPQDDSMTGWNSAGGPFASQWLFQAVNVAVKAITLLNSGGTNSTNNNPEWDLKICCGCLVPVFSQSSHIEIDKVFIFCVGDGGEDPETGSVKSLDSQRSNSLIGLSRLFASNSDLCTSDILSENAAQEATSSRNSHLSTIVTELPKQPARTHDSSSSASSNRRRSNGSRTEEERRRRHYRRSRTPPDQDCPYQLTWRSERETSPRILERLLEESQEPSPSSSLCLGGHGLQMCPNQTAPVPSEPFLPSHLFHRRINNERERSDSSPHHSAFLQSAARELKQQLRALGGQNTLDISGTLANPDRYIASSRSNTQGIFRPRDEPVHCDIDSSTSTVNRHRRLRRLARSRRSLERRRETPYSSPLTNCIASGPGTHMANSYDDTSEGAVHYFQDEFGHWHSYTFTERASGLATPVSRRVAIPPPERHSGSQVVPETDRSHDLVVQEAGQCSMSSEPRQSTSTNRSIKTPSSSESWTSESSSELAVDPSTNKLYSSYRRPMHGHSHNTSHTGSASGGGSPVPSVPSLVTITPEYSSASVQGIASRLPVPNYTQQRNWQRSRRDVLLQVLTDSILERRRLPPTYGSASGGVGGGDVGNGGSSESGAVLNQSSNLSGDSKGRNSSNNNKKKARFYYQMKIVPHLYAKIQFDRLKLMAMFDRNGTFLENMLAIMLAVMSACLGSYMLHRGYYQDLSMVLLCFIMASCQFSLLKSVQPDASSPTHGFNRTVAFSRPIYFCICAGLVYILQTSLDNGTYDYGFRIYGLDLTSKYLLEWTRDFTLVVILFFPLLFSLGLFPQFNTFLIYLFEQVDIHGFGGNATSGLLAVFVSVTRSLAAVAVLYGFAYGALYERQRTQHVLYSIFCGLLVATSYHLSRCASDASVMWSVLKQQFCPDEDCFGENANTLKAKEAEEPGDPLPRKLRDTVNARLKSDAIICAVIGLIAFGLHCSTVFTALQTGLTLVLWITAIVLGFLLHYVVPQFRKQLPFLVVSHPILPSGEFGQFEARDEARLMWFEKLFVWASFFERNIIYPLLWISALTESSTAALVDPERFGMGVGTLIIVTTGLKAFRTSYSDPGKHYLKLLFTLLFFQFDWEGYSESFIVDFYFLSIVFEKVFELWLKLQFVITYIAPWQITWGSAFHAFAQPFSVPHSAMLFLQALVSSIFSAPLNPFLGSAIFITSYVRPVKFWERDYNTKRVDHSNTRLSSHLEKNPGADDNNLNSIFYEHLTRSLQDSLCGDLTLGRWGLVSQGDCFVLASDYLNCLVHIVEVGNGLVTFQMRGLEFRGTYCQQREVEAISEDVEHDDGCCCCEPGKLPHLLSVNAAFSQRWLAWEVTVTKYVLEGYSIADNSAISMLQVFDLRKIIITYYVKSIIYYTVKADKLEEWLEMESIGNALKATLDKQYADLDPVFSVNIDEDFDFTTSGITRNSFCNVYYTWILYCLSKRPQGGDIDSGKDSLVVSLCFALSILGRRALGVASHSNSLSSVEFFLYGLHALFKGDFRITSQRDEWVFTDMDLLRKVVSPAVRTSLKLHQDHFMCPDEYDDHAALYDAITYNDKHLVISHEGDPAWRSAVLAGSPALLALRHVLDDGADEYKIIMLNKRYLSFRVIKLNRECVRGLWAGQQQELVYLRNRDPERGSIQNAKQALRNIINSSCDQPIGYPIYVSPLTTSYADTHAQLCSLVGGSISLSKLRDSAISVWRRIRRRCWEGCSSGSAVPHEDTPYGHDGVYAMTASAVLPASAVVSSGLNLSGSQSLDGSQIGGSSVGRSSLSRGNFNRGSVASNVSGSFGKPSTSTLASLAGFLTDTNGNNREKDKEKGGSGAGAGGGGDKEQSLSISEHRGLEGSRESKSASLHRVRIIDANQVYDGLNLGRRIDVVWPDEAMRARGGRSYWQNWVPEDGMEGMVVHKWFPAHRDPKCRSITDKTILLLKIEDKFVPIAETGVADLGAEV